MVKERQILIVNQAVNYLTIDIANAFSVKYNKVTLLTGNVHSQGIDLNTNIKVRKIIKYDERTTILKLLTSLIAFFEIFYLLAFKYRKHEIVFISIPIFSYLTMLVLRNRFSICVWDFYPESFIAHGITERHYLYRFWAWSNKRLLPRAYRIYTISNSIAELISKYVSLSRITVFPLWPAFNKNDKIKKSVNKFILENNLKNKFIVQYSGNIGLIHNVDFLTEIAAILRTEAHILIQIIGKGEQMNRIRAVIREKKLTNLNVMPFQDDENFPYSLSAANLGVVVLDSRISKASIPSKVYNLMVMGIPVLYVSSKESELYRYSTRFDNGMCFESTDIVQMAEYIKDLSQNKEMIQALSINSENAAMNFTRLNACQIAENYFQN